MFVLETPLVVGVFGTGGASSGILVSTPPAAGNQLDLRSPLDFLTQKYLVASLDVRVVAVYGEVTFGKSENACLSVGLVLELP